MAKNGHKNLSKKKPGIAVDTRQGYTGGDYGLVLCNDFTAYEESLLAGSLVDIRIAGFIADQSALFTDECGVAAPMMRTEIVVGQKDLITLRECSATVFVGADHNLSPASLEA